jgi:hypothetical protein
MTSIVRRPDLKVSRLDREYPIKLSLYYRTEREGSTLDEGCGTTVRIGRSEVVFRSERIIGCGLTIEAFLDWPARFEGVTALRLHISGKTVKTHDGYARIRILRYEFRISNGSRSILNCHSTRHLQVQGSAVNK